MAHMDLLADMMALCLYMVWMAPGETQLQPVVDPEVM